MAVLKAFTKPAPDERGCDYVKDCSKSIYEAPVSNGTDVHLFLSTWHPNHVRYASDL